MGQSTIRLRDIAEKTGFSTNTVSLALRDSPRIPKQTRDVIRAAANELNYLPNQIAKSLVSRKTRTIGLVLTDMTNTIITQTAQALESALAARGYSTLFATSNNRLEEEIRVVEMFRSRQVDGMLIYPAAHNELDHIRRLSRARYPVVLLVGDPDSGLDAVSVDDRSGAFKATRHLIELGHKRIALLDSASHFGNAEKREGYQRALAEAGIGFDPALVVEPEGQAASLGYAATKQVLATNRADPPSALFAATDSLAIGALRWCHEHGIDVPGDLAIIGFDNTEYGEYAAIPLSTIDYAAEQISRQAVDRLMHLINTSDHPPAPEVTLIDPALITRQSTGPAR